jgi:hypothetical protein
MSYINPKEQAKKLNLSMIFIACYLTFFIDIFIGTLIVFSYGYGTDSCQKGIANKGHYIMAIYYFTTGALEYLYVLYTYQKLK